MERLVTDAEKLNKKFKATRDENGKLNASYADIVDAIHIVQQNMGITGTSAEEASTTIQGSMASVKAAWQDTLTAIGSGKDIDKKLDNFTKSVKKYGENMKPVIKQALSGAVKVIGQLAPDIAAELPKLITELAPDVLKAGADIVSNLANGVLNELDRSNFDKTAGKLTEKVNKIIDGFDAEKSGERFSGVINKFINAGFNIASTFDFKKTAEKMTTWLNKAVDNLDVDKLGQTVSNVWKGVWDFIGTALEEIDWENVGNKISEFINSIDWGGILDSMFDVIGNLIKAAPELLKGVVEKLDFESAAGLFATLFAPKMASNLLKKIKEDRAVGKDLASAGSNAGNQIGAGLEGTVDETSSSFSTKLSSALSKAAVVAQAFTVGYAIGTRIREGLEDAGIADWLDEHLGKWLDITPMLEKVVGEQQQKEAEKKAKENNKKSAQALKEAGAWWLSGTGTDSTAAIQKAQQIISEYNKYKQLGVTINDVLNNTAKYEQAKAGKLSTSSSGYQQYQKQQQQNWRNNASYYQPGASAATTPINSSIYLDTGALVGGTSRTSAVQQNYTARGYAT